MYLTYTCMPSVPAKLVSFWSACVYLNKKSRTTDQKLMLVEHCLWSVWSLVSFDLWSQLRWSEHFGGICIYAAVVYACNCCLLLHILKVFYCHSCPTECRWLSQRQFTPCPCLAYYTNCQLLIAIELSPVQNFTCATRHCWCEALVRQLILLTVFAFTPITLLVEQSFCDKQTA